MGLNTLGSDFSNFAHIPPQSELQHNRTIYFFFTLCLKKRIKDRCDSSSCSALSDSNIGCHSMIQSLVICQSNNVHATFVKAFAYPTEKCLSFSSSISFSFYFSCYHFVFDASLPQHMSQEATLSLYYLLHYLSFSLGSSQYIFIRYLLCQGDLHHPS